MATTQYTPNNETPYGYCHCGCGQKTNVIQFSNKRSGIIKGQYSRFLLGHAQRVKNVTQEYIFWSRVAITADDEKCWEWQGACDSSGYGTKNWHGRTISTHRLAWLLMRGEIPNGFYVCHSCDNPRCVNPKHLFIGTSQDNALDRSRKGRNRKQSGEQSTCCKLTSGQVHEIRRRYSTGGITIKQLATEYGISPSQTSRIVHNETWKE